MIDEKQLFATINLVSFKIDKNSNLGMSLVKIDELLTPAEILILELIELKNTTKEIVEKLYVSTFTLKNHRHNIARKLKIGNTGKDSIAIRLVRNEKKYSNCL
jgi:DNA-binding NarL/FixJ family response regulator